MLGTVQNFVFPFEVGQGRSFVQADFIHILNICLLSQFRIIQFKIIKNAEHWSK